LFEFKCDKCHITEENLPISSKKETTKCSICGAEAKRIISKSNFILKGNGWAKDGYNKEK
jgi:putative FmdB family regulatory protein